MCINWTPPSSCLGMHQPTFTTMQHHCCIKKCIIIIMQCCKKPDCESESPYMYMCKHRWCKCSMQAGPTKTEQLKKLNVLRINDILVGSWPPTSPRKKPLEGKTLWDKNPHIGKTQNQHMQPATRATSSVFCNPNFNPSFTKQLLPSHLWKTQQLTLVVPWTVHGWVCCLLNMNCSSCMQRVSESENSNSFWHRSLSCICISSWILQTQSIPFCYLNLCHCRVCTCDQL